MSIKAQEVEVEVAFPSATREAIPTDRLSAAGLIYEDRTSSDWGLTFRLPESEVTDLDSALDILSRRLLAMSEQIRALSPIIRVAIFNRAATCTVRLSRLDWVVDIGAVLELTIYPSE